MKKEKLISIAGWLLSFISILYFFYYAKNNFTSIPSLRIDAFNIILLSLLVFFYVLAVIVAALAWYVLLKLHNVSISKLNAISIYCRAQFSKYLPGNVGHHVGRVLLAKHEGIPIQVTIQTMLIETAWVVSTGAVLSLLALNLVASDIYYIKNSGVSSELLFGIVLFSLIIPIIGIKVANKYFSNTIKRIMGVSLLIVPSILDGIKVISMLLIGFLTVGGILDLIALFMFNAEQSQLIFLVGIYALSWIAGYIVPGAPAGLGIREAVMVSALDPLYGAGVAISMSILLRLLTTLGDFVVFVLGIYSYKLMFKLNKLKK